MFGFRPMLLSGTAAPGGGPLLLDNLSSVIKGAWSVRKLRTAYLGAPIRVSDGTTETDIGFDASGNLDLTALAAAASGGKTLRVVTFYDQTGHGQHVTNIYSNAPAIVSSGAILTLGTTGRPTLVFNSDHPDQLLLRTGGISFTGQAYAFFGVTGVNRWNAGDYRRAISLLGANATYDYNDGAAIPLLFGYASKYASQHGANDYAIVAGTPGTGQADQYASIFDGSHSAITVNGNSGSLASTASSAITWPATLSFGLQADWQHYSVSPSSEWDGGFSECIMIDGAVASGDQAAIRSSERAYFGTA